MTRNNRLIAYQVYSDGGDMLLRTVRYWYEEHGAVEYIGIKDVGQPKYRGLHLLYAENGALHWAATYEWTGSWSAMTGVASRGADEFRGDGPRQRYLARHWAWELVQEDPPVWGWVLDPNSPATWTDSLGDSPWADYDVSGEQTLTAAERLRYLAGAGVAGQEDMAGETAVVRYQHDDLVGSTMLLSDGEGAPVTGQAGDGSVRYSAFGEAMDADGVLGWGGLAETRYRYDGAWGYEAGPWGYAGLTDPDDPNSPVYPNPPGGIVLYGGNPELPAITLVHVGARWYEPDVGRFVQRDPIGIRGGLNEYAYVHNTAVSAVDSEGTGHVFVNGGKFMHQYILVLDPDTGEVIRIDFTPKNGWWGAGQVEVFPVDEPIVNPVPSSPEVDAKMIELAKKDHDNPPRYDLGLYCCWNYNQDLIDRADPSPRQIPWVCFVEGTPILTADGMTAIELIEEGASVPGYCSNAGEALEGLVTRTHVGVTDKLVRVSLENDLLECTPMHPFWCSGRGWVAARDLTPADCLLDSELRPVAIKAIEHISLGRRIRVYNVTVSGAHTYFVGRSKVLVHNKTQY